MFEPIKVNASGPGIESERIPAFIVTKNGGDKVYTIPKTISGATALQALEIYVMHGQGGLVMWLARHALGEEGMNAVLESEHLTYEAATALVKAIGEQYTGQVKELGKQ